MYVGWRDLVHAKGRFMLMAGVVMLIAVLIGLISGLTRGLADESTSAITGLHTSRLVFSGDTPDFSSSRIPLTDGTEVSRLGGEPLGVATGRASTEEHSTPATVMGVRPGTSVAPDAAGIGAGAVVLSHALAAELGLSSGERVDLSGRSFVVTGVRGDASYAHVPVAWLSLDDWQTVTGSDGFATVLATGHSSAPDGYTSVTLDESLAGIGAFTSENGSLQLIRGFLFAISALVVGAFFTVWTVQRSRDLAVLKALGASTPRLVGDALGQALMLLVPGVGLGAAVVWLAGGPARQAVPFVLDLATLGPPMLALVALGLAGAALAVCRISTVDPLTALGSAR